MRDQGWKVFVSMFAVGFTLAALTTLSGCAATGESAQRDSVTRNVGNYSSAPTGVEEPRVGVPPFSVEDQGANFTFATSRLEDMAADQLTTLMHLTNRFSVIERTQLKQLLAEQGLEGIVRPGELAQPGLVRGVDYLLLGKVTSFRVKAERTSQEAGVRGGLVADKLLGGFTGGFNQDKTILTTEVGVDLRLVDPTTGELAASHFSQYQQQDTAESFGLDIAGVGGGGDADVRISEDDAGKIMRLAFDDTIKKMLPQVDNLLRSEWSQSSGGGAASAAGGSSGDGAGMSTPNFCPECGESLSAGAKFCGSCGHQIQ